MSVSELLLLLYTNIQLCSYTATFFVIEILTSLLLLFDNLIKSLLEFFEITTYFNISSSSVALLNMSIKFLICVSLLIFARGGIPRFRFDYLTKLGWIRFLSLVLLFFLVEILLLSLI